MVPFLCFSICAPFSLSVGLLCAALTWVLPYSWLKKWNNRLRLRAVLGILGFIVAYLILSRVSAEIIWREASPDHVNEAWVRHVIPAPFRPACLTAQTVCETFRSRPYPDVTLVLWNLVLSVFSGAVSAFTSRLISRHRLSRTL